MDRTECAIRKLLAALPGHGYDLGILSASRMQRSECVPTDRLLRMLPYLKHRNATGSHIYLRPTRESAYTLLDDLPIPALQRLREEGFAPAAVIETSPGNYQAWLRHAQPFPKELGTLAAKLLAHRFGADSSAADWRRFGRAPGFTNRKPCHRDALGPFPYTRLEEHSGSVFAAADAFHAEIVAAQQEAEQADRTRRLAFRQRRVSFDPALSLTRFRDALQYRSRPAAADLAFSICALAHGWSEAEVASALRANYLSRDTSSQRRAAYIRRTLAKALRRLH